MDTHPGTVTVWQSGRLAPHAAPRRFDLDLFTREQWLLAALSLACVVVLAIYVGVLRRDVNASEMAHMAQRSRAIGQAQCEADRPAEARGRCIALFNGDVATLETAPPAAGGARDERAGAARGVTVSLVGR
jgi:hypothetical protein